LFINKKQKHLINGFNETFHINLIAHKYFYLSNFLCFDMVVVDPWHGWVVRLQCLGSLAGEAPVNTGQQDGLP
jgi:hypothetical protein